MNIQDKSFFTAIIFQRDQKYGQFIKHIFDLFAEIQSKILSNESELKESLKHQQPDLITLELSPNETENSNLINYIKEHGENTLIIAVLEEKDAITIFNAGKIGVFDFILKNDEIKTKLTSIISKFLTNDKKKFDKKNQNIRTRNKKPELNIRNHIIGESQAIKNLDELILKASDSNINVLISGETGTGKELIAKFIHENSARNKLPLISVNMAAIPAELLESELFGHEKGAFTGASTQRIGKFELAGSGSIFLDEIGEMDYSLQAKILRVLQEKEIVRVGGTKNIKINCRIITATNRDLQEEVANGKFREDLFYRLFGLNIHLPPLRDRGKDKLLISNFIVKKYCEENGREFVNLSDEAKEKIMKYGFPGNIRELKSSLELAIVLCENNQIKASDIRLNQSFNLKKTLHKEKSMDDYQKEILKHYLDRYDRNVLRVAERLRLGKSTIYRMLKENNEYFGYKNLETTEIEESRI